MLAGSDGVLTTSIVEHSKNNSSKGPQGLWSIGSKDLKPFLNTDMPCALLQVNQGNLAVVGQHVSHDGNAVFYDIISFYVFSLIIFLNVFFQSF